MSRFMRKINLRAIITAIVITSYVPCNSLVLSSDQMFCVHLVASSMSRIETFTGEVGPNYKVYIRMLSHLTPNNGVLYQQHNKLCHKLSRKHQILVSFLD